MTTVYSKTWVSEFLADIWSRTISCLEEHCRILIIKPILYNLSFKPKIIKWVF